MSASHNPPPPTTLQRDSSERAAGFRLVAFLLFGASLCVAVAFWQAQQVQPRKLHAAAVAEHGNVLFRGLQDDLQTMELLLASLALRESADPSAAHFARQLKNLSPALRRLSVQAAFRVSRNADAEPLLLPLAGASPDMEVQLARILASAQNARRSGLLAHDGNPESRWMLLAHAERDGSVNGLVLDAREWLTRRSRAHERWLNADLQGGDGKTAFAGVSPALSLGIRGRDFDTPGSSGVIATSGILLLGFLTSLLVWMVGSRGHRAEAAAQHASLALGESQERLQRAMQLTRDGIWEFDARHHSLYLSPQASALLGLEEGESPRPVAVLRRLPQAWRRELLYKLKEAARSGIAQELRMPLGSALNTRWLRIRVRSAQDARHDAALLTGSIADISDEMAQSDTQERYRAMLMRVLDALPVPVALHGADQQILMMNERYATDLMDSLDPNRLSTQAPDLVARIEALDLDAIRSNAAQSTHAWVQCTDGDARYLRITRVLCDGLDGEPNIVASYEDLTELRQQTQSHAAERAFFQRIIDCLPNSTYIKDAEHRYILTNQAHARENHMRKDDILGKRAWDFTPAAAAAIEAAEDALLAAESGTISENEMLLEQNDEQRHVVIRKIRIEDPEGRPVLLGVNANVTRLRETEADLRRQAAQQSHMRAFLQAVFDAVPHPLFVKDSRHRYVMSNRAHAESVGARSVEEIIGKRSEDFVTQEVAAEIEAAEEHLFAQGPTGLMHNEFVLQQRNGKTRHTIICKALCIHPDGQTVLVGVLTDITHLRDVEDGLRRHRDQLSDLVREQTLDLVRAKELAERANETKSIFLTNMSHELRTPLHAILSFARLGEERVASHDDARLRDYFNRIRVSGDRLLGMLTDLLDLARLESGRVQLDLRPVTLEHVIGEVSHEFEAWLTARHLQLSTEIAPGLPRITGDAAQLGRVLRNLLGNAIKFSPEGGSLTLNVRHAQEKGCEGLLLTLADEGPGVPENELESIFETFVQSSRNRAGSGGTGLGLAISREIVTAHKGRISACNRPGGGACFSVFLPINQDSALTREVAA